MRLIDADALMEVINRHCYPIQHDMTSIEPGMTRIGILQAIQEQPTIEPKRKTGRWIPCSERLPEDTVIVTVETKTFKHKYVCEAVWVPRWSKKAEYDNWEDCSEYNEDEDEYYVLEGWYERVHNWDEYSFVGIEDDVIAWMPLPEPYKGENE